MMWWGTRAVVEHAFAAAGRSADRLVDCLVYLFRAQACGVDDGEVGVVLGQERVGGVHPMRFSQQGR